MKIPYYIRNVYGKPIAYVSNPDLANIIKCLTRRVTLDEMDFKALQSLGHELVMEHDPESLRKML